MLYHSHSLKLCTCGFSRFCHHLQYPSKSRFEFANSFSNRLQSPCNATSDTVAACQGAFNDLSGLSGDNAVDAWSGALGIGGDHDHGDRTLTSVFMPDYATTVTTTVYSIEPGTSVFTTLTLVTSTTTTSTYTDYIFTTYSSPSPSSTLTITITLPALTATSESTQSTSVKTTISTQVYYTVTTMSATATAAGAENTQTPQSHGGNGDPGGDSGGGSPFDSGVGKASTAMYLCVLAALYLMIHNAA